MKASVDRFDPPMVINVALVAGLFFYGFDYSQFVNVYKI